MKRKKEIIVKGIYTGNARGFGFVTAEGFEKDLFIPPDSTGGAFDGDTVLVKLHPTFHKDQDHRQSAEVIRVVERGITEIVGTFIRGKNGGSVVPDRGGIHFEVQVEAGDDPLTASAVTGHKVVVKITDYGAPGVPPKGKITEIIGHMDDPGKDIESIIRAYRLPGVFPEDAAEEARRMPQKIDFAKETEEVRIAREDLRKWPTVTIDGPSTKDIDDAVSVMRDGKNYILGVHIADVSEYVTEGSPLDAEALQRGTSIYLADRVIPMLPHELSNGICSLNQGEDRYALSCIMTIDPNGEIIDSRIGETIIRSDAKLSYPGVMKLFEEEDSSEIENALKAQGYRGVKTRTADLVRMMKRARKLAAILKKCRHARGAVDFELRECEIDLDENGRPVRIREHEHNEATELIEDFMLAANETVAALFYWLDVPFVYRSHLRPDPDRIDQLKLFIRSYGYKLKEKSDAIHPAEIRRLLEELKGKPEEAMISRMTLRSMQKAVYSPECGGHFGLALDYYTHFTSPIRRYPDLQIHRIMKDYIHGRLNEEKRQHYNDILESVCTRCSERERLADEAERETDKLKKAEYMSEHIGETFEGVVSGVIGRGFFVELENTVEGMVTVESLVDDYYNFDETHMRLTGERTGNTFELGQKVKVMCESTDVMLRTVTFVWAPDPEDAAAKKVERPGRKSAVKKKAGQTSRKSTGQNKKSGGRKAVAGKGIKDVKSRKPRK